MTQIPGVTQPSKHNPIYLLIAKDETVSDLISYYLIRRKQETSATIDFQGYEISKTEYNKLVKKPELKTMSKKKELNLIVPLDKIIKMINITYNK